MLLSLSQQLNHRQWRPRPRRESLLLRGGSGGLCSPPRGGGVSGWGGASSRSSDGGGEPWSETEGGSVGGSIAESCVGTADGTVGGSTAASVAGSPFGNDEGDERERWEERARSPPVGVQHGKLWGSAAKPAAAARALSRGSLQVASAELSQMAEEARAGSNRTPDVLRVFVGTWNMNARQYNDQDISSWLALPRAAPGDAEHERGVQPEPEAEEAPFPPDLVVLGCQEFCVLNAQHLFLTSKLPKASWERLVLAMLSHMHGCQYVPVRSEGGETPQQLVGLLLGVYVREPLAAAVGSVRAEAVKTGLGGLSGAKGALALRFTLLGESFCFVNMHLPAGATAEAKELRNSAAREVMRHLNASYTAAGLPTPAEHEACWAFGDLNYRLTLSSMEVRWRVWARAWRALLLYDQLAPQLTGEPGGGGSGFHGFHEADINFRPTYKFDIGTNNYDTSEKKRVPAWTDRILWRGCSSHPRPLLYEACHNTVTSDHKPVKALFELSLPR